MIYFTNSTPKEKACQATNDEAVSLPCALLTDPPFVLALLWLARALGRLLLRRSQDELFCLGVGLGALQFVFFGLGSVGLARPWALALVLLALALVARREFFPLPRLRRPKEPLEWLLTLAVLCFFPLAVAPVTDHDGQFYHLTAVKRWLETGRLDYLPTLTMTQWPMGIDMLYGLCLGLWSDTAAKLLHGMLGVLTLLTLAALGERLGNRSAGLSGGAVLVILARGEFGAAYIDLGSCLFTALALLSIATDRPQALTALLCGFAASAKLSGAFVGLVMFCVLCPKTPRERALFLALALAPALPYFLRSWLLTGNPLYPALASVFPTRDWYPALSPIFLRFNQLYNWASNYDWSEPERQTIRVGLAGLALAGALLAPVHEPTVKKLTRVTLVLLAATLWLAGPYPRYLLPVLPPLAVLLLSRLRLRLTMLPCMLAGLVALGVGVPALRQAPAALPAIVGGKKERTAYLAQQLSLYPVLRWINQKTPRDARILLVADTAYYCDRPCWLAHPYLQGALRLTRYEDFVSDVVRARLTHVLVGRGEQPISGRFPTENQVRFAQRLGRERGRLVFQNDEVELWEL